MLRATYPLKEIEKTSFDFICPFCFNPWYEEIQTKLEICVSKNCIMFDNTLGFKPSQISDDFRKEIERERASLIARLLRFDDMFIRTYLFEARSHLLRHFHEDGRTNIPRFFALSELLLELNSHKPVGRSRNVQDAEKLVSEYGDFLSRLNLIDDILTFRVYLAAENRVYYIKPLSGARLQGVPGSGNLRGVEARFGRW